MQMTKEIPQDVLTMRTGPIGKKGVTYAAFLRGVTNLWGISPWIAADG